MFIKQGDLNPITIIKPIDVDNESTKKTLKNAIKAIKDLEEKVAIPVSAIEKESEKKVND